MSFLLDRERNTWDLNKINELLNPRVLAGIFNITLSRMPREDKCFWAEERSKFFSVKGAYRLI